MTSKKLVKLHVRMLWAPYNAISPLLIDTMQSSHVGRAGSSDAVDRPAQLYIRSSALHCSRRLLHFAVTGALGMALRRDGRATRRSALRPATPVPTNKQFDFEIEVAGGLVHACLETIRDHLSWQ